VHIPAYYWVINTGTTTHQDKHSGEIYTFKPGEPALVDWAIVNLFFGFDEPNKSNCLQRLGWVQPTSKPEMVAKAAKRLEAFHIELAEFAPPRGPA
jgi:hypothetical protein